jgi:hypothetical protein
MKPMAITREHIQKQKRFGKGLHKALSFFVHYTEILAGRWRVLRPDFSRIWQVAQFLLNLIGYFDNNFFS